MEIGWIQRLPGKYIEVFNFGFHRTVMKKFAGEAL